MIKHIVIWKLKATADGVDFHPNLTPSFNPTLTPPAAL
jgi:hypothetical protein